MIFKNYEYFITIAAEGSISKAAEKLYISQPSLSKYLKRLEDNVGEELFYRDAYPLKLTPSGELYHSYIKDISAKEKRLLEEFSYLKTNDVGYISIGITVWRSSIFMPRILPIFSKKYPAIQVKLLEGSHKQLANMLDNDKVDFCVFHLPNNYTSFTFEHLQYERILFCVNQNNPQLAFFSDRDFSKVIHISNEEFLRFSDESFILLKQGQNLREISQNYLNKLSLSPQIPIETSNIVTAINMVKAGMGVTFVPETALSFVENLNGVCYFAVDAPAMQWEIGIAYKNNAPPKRQARLFINCMKEILTP